MIGIFFPSRLKTGSFPVYIEIYKHRSTVATTTKGSFAETLFKILCFFFPYGISSALSQGVIQWLPHSDVAKISWINEDESLVRGKYLTSFRKNHSQDRLVQTGTLKILSVHGSEIIASIEENSQEGQMYFPDYPYVMANDLVELKQSTVVQKQYFMPTIVLSYKDLFLYPDPGSLDFQLSEVGKKILKSSLEPYLNKKFTRLLITSFTGIHGEYKENQVESYQRALSLEEILIREFQVSPSRLVSVGQGENDPVDKSGFGDVKNRRIVFEFF